MPAPRGAGTTGASSSGGFRKPAGARGGGGARPGGGPRNSREADAQREPDPILFQNFFKSVGPRTYAAQVKSARNGNQYLVLTEGKRDAATGEVRKTRLFIYSEDFDAFVAMLRETATWIRAHPVSEKVRWQRERFWAKQQKQATPDKPPSPASRPTATDRAAEPRPPRPSGSSFAPGRFAAAYPSRTP